ncbi:MAG: DUF4268 domain-containing protein [Anaerolineae bacterium]|nr:DUF4268 domain-containing protein [Anaerolineae bacterium]
MKADNLGRLEPVDPREVWSSEAADFTPWLARKENLALLGDVIGLELEPQATEQSVGPYRADIVCQDTATGSLVLIENQLERSDHTHLGQLLTYAAGLNTVTIVWIARRFTDEHRAALDWLNDISGSEINFFGLEVEVWRIGESNRAPKFNIATQPNDWIKTIASQRDAASGSLTQTQAWQLEYWTDVMTLLEENSRIIKPRKPRPQYWVDFAVGRTDFSLEAVVDARKRQVSVSLAITARDAKAFYHLLNRDKQVIETELGAPLTWQELPKKKSSYVSLYLKDVDLADRADWPRQQRWIMSQLEAFHRCFSPRVKSLDSSAYVSDADEAARTLGST